MAEEMDTTRVKLEPAQRSAALAGVGHALTERWKRWRWRWRWKWDSAAAAET